MKKLLLIIFIAIAGDAYGQITTTIHDKYGVSKCSTRYQQYEFKRGDTLYMFPPFNIHYIAIGDKVYQIVEPKAYIELMPPIRRQEFPYILDTLDIRAIKTPGLIQYYNKNL